MRFSYVVMFWLFLNWVLLLVVVIRVVVLRVLIFGIDRRCWMFFCLWVIVLILELSVFMWCFK